MAINAISFSCFLFLFLTFLPFIESHCFAWRTLHSEAIFLFRSYQTLLDLELTLHIASGDTKKILSGEDDRQGGLRTLVTIIPSTVES